MRIAFISALMALVAVSAEAQVPCGPREGIVKELRTKYGEEVQVTGVMGNGKFLMEMWVNSGQGTWTVTLTDPNGKTCAVAAGSNWQLIKDRGDPT